MKSIYLLVSVIFFSIAGAAELPKSVATYNHWRLYSQIEEGRKVCFIASMPEVQYGNYSKRSTPYIWVRYISNNIDEVSLTPGYPFKKNIPASVGIYEKIGTLSKSRSKIVDFAKNGECSFVNEDHSYVFDIIDEEQAWVKDIEHDEEMINYMKAGSNVVVTALSRKGTCSTDIYSLIGFTKAYNHMKELCS